MANKQIEMRKAKRIFKLYSAGVSKRQISKQLGLSRNTVTKYIAFFKRYNLTAYEVDELTLEELDKLFKSEQRTKSGQLQTLEKYFPYFATNRGYSHVGGDIKSVAMLFLQQKKLRCLNL